MYRHKGVIGSEISGGGGSQRRAKGRQVRLPSSSQSSGSMALLGDQLNIGGGLPAGLTA